MFFAFEVVACHLNSKGELEGHNCRHQINLGQLFLHDVLIKLSRQHVQAKIGEQISNEREKSLDLFWRQQSVIFVELFHVQLLNELDHIEDEAANKVDHQR